ncbi:unnamed protein product, partial [marine sediment metagenome]
ALQAGQAGQGLNQFIGQGPVNQQIQGLTNASQNFIDKQLNNISGQSNLFGGFGGGRSQVAQGAAIGEAGAGLGLGIGNILQQDFGRQQQAATSQGQQQLLGNQLGQQGLGNIFGLFNQGLLGQFGGLQSQQGLVGAPTVLGGATTGPGLGHAMGSAFAGGFGQGLGSFAAASDRRLKRNIAQVGHTDAGQNVYEFEYLWSPQRYIGVMAQESPPDAVIRHPSGFLMVDYARIH